MDIFKDVKFWIGIFVTVLAVTLTVGGYTSLPKKVEANTLEIDTNETSLEKLSNTVEKYIAVQAIKQEFQDMRQQTLENIVINQTSKRKKKLGIF